MSTGTRGQLPPWVAQDRLDRFHSIGSTPSLGSDLSCHGSAEVRALVSRLIAQAVEDPRRFNPLLRRRRRREQRTDGIAPPLADDLKEGVEQVAQDRGKLLQQVG